MSTGLVSICRLDGTRDFTFEVEYDFGSSPANNGVRFAASITGVSKIERDSYSVREVGPNATDTLQGVPGPAPTRGKMRYAYKAGVLSAAATDWLGQWVAINPGPPANLNGQQLVVSAWSHDFAFDDKRVVITVRNISFPFTQWGSDACGE